MASAAPTPTATPISSMTDDKRAAVTELSKLQSSHHLLQRRLSQQWSLQLSGPYSIGYFEIIWTAVSILVRVVGIFLTVKLACDYYDKGEVNHFAWTMICIVVPMFITTLIHANMVHQDGKFNEGIVQALVTLLLLFVSSFFRYWKSLVYSILCKRAERNGDKEAQLKYFKLNIREESDVAFIRLFECFFEAAPQKILQIAIVLNQPDKMTYMQIITICLCFGSMTWCLTAYHRNNRYAQIDKYNLNLYGLVFQICWHFCISVSRTLCIAFVASVFPLWTIVACLCHALVLGFITFIVDRPKFATTSFLNFLFCLVMGIVYLFSYISVKDAPTFLKYLLYYLLCSIESISCVVLFMLFASPDLKTLAFLFYPLCAMAIAFYYIGIVFMIIYYCYFHPKITARNSKRIINNN